ncbi:2875_t:CDS:2 [Funneliformis geosporum]|uniref:2875_t:CDS:1 n=1 Tax=Funneliformis geosporum TaxID=1117311 RepID=A0A9W4SN78_9GLOM|nr:2875_t:CDS:2 [Funneliformis geosporum]
MSILENQEISNIAQKVPIPVDLPNTRETCYDYRLYFKKSY